MNGGGFGNCEGQDGKNTVIDVNPDPGKQNNPQGGESCKKFLDEYEEYEDFEDYREYEDYHQENQHERRCDDFFRNFNFYFTLGMNICFSTLECMTSPQVW